MSEPLLFWQLSLMGDAPETTPGFPHCGYYITSRYISIPGAKKRTLVDFPAAIEMNGERMVARVSDLMTDWTLDKLDEIDDVFSWCCRRPISHDDYLERVQALSAFRSGERES